MKPFPKTPAAMSGLQHTIHKGFFSHSICLRNFENISMFVNIDNQHFIQNLGLSAKAGDIL